MSEEQYREFMVRAVSRFMIGAFVFACCFLWIAINLSQNGRFVQYDMQKEYSPDGKTHVEAPSCMLIDTRTGNRITPD